MRFRNRCEKITLLHVSSLHSPAKRIHAMLQAGRTLALSHDAAPGLIFFCRGSHCCRRTIRQHCYNRQRCESTGNSRPWGTLRVTGRSQRQVGARTSLPWHADHASKAAGMPSSLAAFTLARRRVPYPWSGDAVQSDPLPPGGTPRTSQSRKDGSSRALCLQSH